MRLLLTGFEPFRGEIVNPAEEVVRAIGADPPPGVELTVRVLPVQLNSAFEYLLPALTAEPYDAWLGLGEAGGRAHLSVERVGINVFVNSALPPDQREEQMIVEGGPAAYFSRLPQAALAQRIRAAGSPAAVSNTAGTYYCNESLYAVQHHLATIGTDIPSGLIHLPYLPQQVDDKPPGTPSMLLQTQLIGVRAAIAGMRELVNARFQAMQA
jgi:pyroglutamyl-peptidase